jgi:hypothetical protein
VVPFARPRLRITATPSRWSRSPVPDSIFGPVTGAAALGRRGGGKIWGRASRCRSGRDLRITGYFRTSNWGRCAGPPWRRENWGRASRCRSSRDLRLSCYFRTSNWGRCAGPPWRRENWGRASRCRSSRDLRLSCYFRTSSRGRCGGGKMGSALVRNADVSVMPCELVESVWRWGPPTGTVDCLL